MTLFGNIRGKQYIRTYVPQERIIMLRCDHKYDDCISVKPDGIHVGFYKLLNACTCLNSNDNQGLCYIKLFLKHN